MFVRSIETSAANGSNDFYMDFQTPLYDQCHAHAVNGFNVTFISIERLVCSIPMDSHHNVMLVYSALDHRQKGQCLWMNELYFSVKRIHFSAWHSSVLKIISRSLQFEHWSEFWDWTLKQMSWICGIRIRLALNWT